MAVTFEIRDILNSIVDQYARKHKASSGQMGLFDDPSEKQRPLFSKRPEDEDGRWITMRGARVFISNDDGRILKGPKHFTGKTVEQIEQGGRDSEEKKPNPKPLAELGKISGGRAENRQLGLFETLNPGLFKDEFEKAFREKLGVGIDGAEPESEPSPSPTNELTRPEWDKKVRDDILSIMGDIDYDNADIERMDGIDAIDRAVSFAYDSKRSYGDQIWALNDKWIDSMPEFESEPSPSPAEEESPEEKESSEEPFTLQQPKPERKQTDFGSSDATKQGALFDTGKPGELKGQELLFNSDAGDVGNPKTMENRAKNDSLQIDWRDRQKRKQEIKAISDQAKALDYIRERDVGEEISPAVEEAERQFENSISLSAKKLGIDHDTLVNAIYDSELASQIANMEGPFSAKGDGPNDGDTNAEGLVFRDGRWHRDEEEEQSGQESPSSVPKAVSKPEPSSSEKLQKQKDQAKKVLSKLRKISEDRGWPEGKIRVSKQDVEKAVKGTTIDAHILKTGLLDVQLQDMGDGTFHVHDRTEQEPESKASPSPAETKSPADSIQSHLDNDDHQSAFEAFSKLKKDEVDKVARQVLGMGFYNKSKAQMLEALKRTLPLATKTASDAAQKQEEIDYAEMKLRKAKENQQAHSKDRLGAPIHSGVPEIAYTDPHGEGRAEVAKAWQAEVDDAQRELDRVSGKQAAEEEGPQDGDINEKGLIFRNGRWHRDGEEVNPSEIAQRARDNNENIWSAAKRDLGVNSMAEIPPELRKELADAMAVTNQGKAPEVKPPSPGRQRAMEKQEEQRKQEEEETKQEPITASESIKEAVSKAVSKKMEDFGEYIPGARKEGAKKLGPRSAKTESAETKKPTWMKPFEVSRIMKSSDKSEEGKWSITSQKQKDWMGQAKQLGVFDTEAEAEKAIPLLAVAQNHRTKKMPDGTYAIIRDLAKGKYPVVKGGFETDDAAMKYIADHPIEIIEHKFPRYESLQYLERVQRDGKDHRKGKDIKPDDFKKDFNLRGGQFGNWQSGKDGQISLNHAFDSFHDLADTLGLDKGAITLDGKLAMAFGARGTGGENAARAHYEPGERIINLTKMAGAGTLAHEWAHALDHMIAGMTQEKNGSSAVAMQSYSLKKHARPEVAEAVSNLYNTMMAHTEEEAIQAPKTKYSEKMEAQDKENREQSRKNNMAMAFPRTLDDHLWNVKKNLESMARYKKKELKPEQVKEFDELAAKIAGGDAGKGMLTEGKRFGGGRMTFENLEKLNDLHKKMVGRGFHTNDDHSLGTNIYHKISSERHVAERVKQAEAGQTEKRKKRTSFLNEAVELDQHRVGTYYTQPEEMMARAFEGYISDKLEASGQRSDYLIGKGKTNNDRYRAAGIGAPFPEGEERVRINAAFDRLFDTLRGNELKAAEKKESSGKEQYSRTSYSNLKGSVLEIVDRYCHSGFKNSVSVDHYAHPLIHAAVGGLAHMAVNKTMKGTMRTIAHAAVAAVMASWLSSAMAANQNQNQNHQTFAPLETAHQRQQAGIAAVNQIVANAIAQHDQRKQAAAAAPPSPAVQAAHSVSARAGAAAGVRPLRDPETGSAATVAPVTSGGAQSAAAGSAVVGSTAIGIGTGIGTGTGGSRPLKDPEAGSSSGNFNADHPRHPAGSPESKGGEFAPKGEQESPSSSAEESGGEQDDQDESTSSRNYPDNLNKPANEQTNYAPPERSVNNLAKDQFENRAAWKSPAAPNPRKAIREQRSSIPSSQIITPGPSAEELKAQKKLQQQQEREQQKAEAKKQKELERATSFDPDELDSESMVDDKEFNIPKPREEDFQTPRHLAKVRRWRSQRPMSNGPGDEAAIAKWRLQEPQSFESAMKEWNRRKGAHQAAITKKISKNVVPEIATENELDPAELQAAVDDEIASLLPQHKRQEEARKYVSEMGFHAGRLNRMEDSGKDHSSTNMDEQASEWAGLFPEIAGTDEGKWVEKMWDLSKQGVQYPPSAGDEDLVRRVAQRIMEQNQLAASSFPAEEGESDGDFQPVHGSPGDVDYTPFSRSNVGILVDRYMRQIGLS